jgi:hypothetical protein
VGRRNIGLLYVEPVGVRGLRVDHSWLVQVGSFPMKSCLDVVAE